MRLIDADVFTGELKKFYCSDCYNALCQRCYIQRILFDIDKQPTVEADPITHGHWQGVNPMVDTIECSNCGHQELSNELATPYCAWCGANMDGSEEFENA